MRFERLSRVLQDGRGPVAAKYQREFFMPSSELPTGDKKRFAIIAPSLAGVLRDRALLIRAVRDRGHEVLVLAPSQLAGEIAALHALGCEHRNFDPKPPGLSLLANRRLMIALRDSLSAWKADTVLVSAARLASIAARAARKAGIKHIVTLISDLGDSTAVERARRAASYRRAVKVSGAVVCHNTADAETVAKTLKLANGNAPVVTPGAGIDVAEFPFSPLPEGGGPVVFLMIADPDERAALEAYASAARAVAGRGLPARFRLATDREAAQDTTLLTVTGVEFQGRATDPRALLAEAHVAVHLSVDDGCPTAIREALAAGRPILTLDLPGCREAVDERVNGCLVPPDDPQALITAMASFVAHRDLIPSEGRASRAKAERFYETGRAVTSYLAALRL
jgi:glycosyltransferase involved in cell wall biosynthesis